MSSLNQFRKHLKPGKVYRRAELESWSGAIDRHLAALIKDGTLQKLSAGLYYYPKASVFGILPPDDKKLVREFLRDDQFLITSPNDYNRLSVGTTQLYNRQVVYNHKRHGQFRLGERMFTFISRHRFPKKLSDEFLLVDLLNNLNNLAEDKDVLVRNIAVKAKTMDRRKLKKSVMDFATIKTKNIVFQFLQPGEDQHVE